MATPVLITRNGASKLHGRDNFTVVAARSVTLAKNHPLPTPPNSISPPLPPHGLHTYGTRAATAAAAANAHVEIDSDLDLQCAAGQDIKINEMDSPGLGASGVITPVLLAKHHLPDILVAHGPLAIRHITGYLTTSVPGFSGIPPAKARRMVVAALEGRGVVHGEEEDIHDEVKFEKVGWGRWKARVVRPAKGNSPLPHTPVSYALGLPISKSSPGWTHSNKTRLNLPIASSWAGNSATFSHDDDDVDMLEDEADKMSMDGSCSSSEAPLQDDQNMDDDTADITDDEDWASVGAAALRAASGSARSGLHLAALKAHIGGSYGGGGGGGPNLIARVVAPSLPHFHSTNPTIQHKINNFDFSTSNPQERDAVEALLKLGSA